MTDTKASKRQPYLLPTISDPPQTVRGQGEGEFLSSTELRRLIRVLHRILRDSEGSSSLIERFDELTKSIYCKIHDEKGSTSSSYQSSFRIERGDTDEVVAGRIRTQFRSLVSRRPDLFPKRFCQLQMSDPTIRKLVEQLSSFGLSNVAEDLKGLVYEEIIRNTFDKGDNQQFFTPRPIVEFMVQVLDPSLKGKICDPACGTGGFLIYVEKYLRQKGDSSDVSLIGFEIDERLSWVAGVNLDIHDPACKFTVSHINSAGSLGDSLKPYFGTLDAIITNPPFGSDLTEESALTEFKLGQGRTSRRRGVLFIERCLDLLRPDGSLAIIIDDGVLNGPSNVDTRRLILQKSHPLAIISLPDTAFMPYASVKASILFLKKKGADCRHVPKSKDKLTFFANAEVVGRKPNGDPLLRYGQTPSGVELHSDFPEIIQLWKSGPTPKVPDPGWSSGKCFWAEVPSIEDVSFARESFRIDPAYHHPARRGAEDALLASRYLLRSLIDICELRNEVVVPCRDLQEEQITYLGLANIEPRTGVYTPTLVNSSSLRSSVKRFSSGDILFSKMRPELRKVCLIGDEINIGFASSECLVLTPKRDPETAEPMVLPRLLNILLRSDLVYGQLVHLITGIGRPRLSMSAVLNVRLPVPHPDEQANLLHLYQQSAMIAATLVAESDRGFKRASDIMSDASRNLINDILRP